MLNYDEVLQKAAECMYEYPKHDTVTELHPMIFKDLWLWVHGFYQDHHLYQVLHMSNSDYYYAELAKCILDWAGT